MLVRLQVRCCQARIQKTRLEGRDGPVIKLNKEFRTNTTNPKPVTELPEKALLLAHRRL